MAHAGADGGTNIAAAQLRAADADGAGIVRVSARDGANEFGATGAHEPGEANDFAGMDLAERALPHARRDRAELEDFARDELGLDALEAWDLAYVSEKLKQARYSYSEQEVKRYFTEPGVLAALRYGLEQDPDELV